MGRSQLENVSGKAMIWTSVVAVVGTAAVVGGGAMMNAGSTEAAPAGAEFSKTSEWETGYTGQYVVTNNTRETKPGWSLEFDMPQGAQITSLWDASWTMNGQHVTVKPPQWDTDGLAAGESATVGFVVQGTTGGPANCSIDGSQCSGEGREQPRQLPLLPAIPATPTTHPVQPTDPVPGQPQRPITVGFSPYVDTSLYPAFDLLSAAEATGVKDYHLAFITDGGNCTPKWGGTTDLANNAVAGQIGKLRDRGGDVRVSFGGANGIELGLACQSADALAKAYGKVVDEYGLTKVDFDIEGGSLGNAAANTRRAQAIAKLQQQRPDLDVSFTLPVMPDGLTQMGVDLLSDAKNNGVHVSTVNIMAMDYGASFSGDMGDYAEQAATATQGQIKKALVLDDGAAWKTLAVTPMIGVNDVSTEVFKLDDATQLVAFAKSKSLGGLSMWSATRDKPCPQGPKPSADPTCSSIDQKANAFAKAFAAYSAAE
ncbi:cellulose binding domain-containing protein [Streptomyces sp. NPDC002514]|uniref:cellulose binding domain-containing protein n=1 Tax=Streptomyces sp. NPDC001270 TaxID=3364554 RepID=UPI0036A6C94D